MHFAEEAVFACVCAFPALGTSAFEVVSLQELCLADFIWVRGVDVRYEYLLAFPNWAEGLDVEGVAI